MKHRGSLGVSLFVALALLLPPLALPTAAAHHPATLDGSGQAGAVADVPPPQVDIGWGRMPVYFVENRGQVDGPAAYYIQGRDRMIYFTAEGVTFALTTPLTPTLSTGGRAYSLPSPSQEDRRSVQSAAIQGPGVKATRWVMKLDFVGANPAARPVGEERQEAVVSYFKSRPDEWHTALPTYTRLVYHELWPGIDLVYYGTADRLKYEFIVQPGADPAQIRLAYRGATAVGLNVAGQLEVKTPLGSVADDPPVAYQERDEQRVAVAARYDLLPTPHKEEGVQFGFAVGPYDPSRLLVIDPAVLVYCGYIGGAGDDYGRDIAVDGVGNAYILGYTWSSEAMGFPTTIGPDLTYNGDRDAFVAKVEADGTGLVYAGYIGGADREWGFGIAVDRAGNAYVTGYTESSEAAGFPVTVGPDLTFNGNSDAFVAKITADGTGLAYAGYIGGSDWDEGRGIAVDEAGNAYATGDTTSSEANGFPVAVGPDLTYNDGQDAFVAKVQADGTGLAYAGYIGGSDLEFGFSIAVDGAGNAYVKGETKSSEAEGFPAMVGPDLTFNGGYGDAFVAKVQADGTGLAYAGYIGGSDGDFGEGIAVDGAGNAYVTGWTDSSEGDSFPVTVGPDLTYNGGYGDAFVAKVQADGTGLAYAGYIGGASDDFGLDIAVDGAGNAYVTGEAHSSEAEGFPVTVGPDLTYNGGADAFVAKVQADGTGLAYAGYIGGVDYDGAFGIAVDGAGSAYVTGWTGSSEGNGFPVTVGPDLTYNGGERDALVAKVSCPTLKWYLPLVVK